MKPERLDHDLQERVAAAGRRPLVAAAIGFAGVALMVLIEVVLYGGRLSPVGYAAIGLAFAVVEATVLGTGLSARVLWRVWALREQRAREERRALVRRSGRHPALSSSRMHALVEAEIEEDDDP